MDRKTRKKVFNLLGQNRHLTNVLLNESDLEGYLSLPKPSLNSIPSFYNSIAVYRATTKLQNSEIEETLGYGNSQNVLSRRKRVTETRHPRMHGERFFNICKSGENQYGSLKRIPILLYNKNSGDLILRKDLDDPVDFALKYLSQQDKEYGLLELRINYLAGVLSESGLTQVKIPNKNMWPRVKRLFDFAEEKLGLVPLYLVPHLREEELIHKRSLIEGHIGKLRDEKERVVDKKAG